MLHVQSLLFGCLLCLVVTSVVNADGRVFVVGPRSLSGVPAFRDAQQACASQQARLASVDELRHAVAECYFSQCTRGWLHGGTVGTTVCNIEGSSLKAVNVRTENGTQATAHLSAFCIKDKAVACGDPPSFPNARLQESSGFEVGDELLYTCVPGYVMPSGRSAFSLLCDSCGEWYGTVQLCVKDKTESHVDYEDKFEDSYEAADHDRGSPEEQHDKTSEEVFASRDGKISLQQQATRFRVNLGAEHQDERDVGAAVISNRRAFGGAAEEAVKGVEQERSEVVGTDAAEATEEPVSLLSQKHLFWFPSEAFQNEKPPLSSDSVTQTKQRASGAQSQESKEKESQERHDISHPTDDDDDDRDDERDRYDELDNDERGDHDDSRHDDHDDHDDHDNHDDHDDHDNHDDHDDHQDDLTDNPDDPDSHQEEDDDHVMHRGEHEDRRDRHKDHDDHDDHYDMGTHEKDRDRVHYGTQEYDVRDDLYEEHHSREDHDDATEDRDDDNDDEHPDGSEEHPDHDDHDDDHLPDHDNHDDDDHLPDHDDHDDHDDHNDDDHLPDHDIEDKYDDRDSHEDDDSHSRVIFSVATEERPNITQRGAGSKTTKDETWLDGYPIQGTENGDSTKKPVRPVDGERVVKTTDRPNDVEVRKRIPHTSSPGKRESPTAAPERLAEKVRPGFRTPGASPDYLEPSDFPSYSDTLDYDTQQAAPTQSWLDELTEHPFLDHGLAPPVHDGDVFTGVIGEHAVHNLPGEMGEVEGEMGETICAGDDCPPHPPSSSSRGPTVAAIAVLVCVVAMAVIFGVWCYKRQQQKSSIYEMDGKGQSQSRQGQQMEMQQKV